MRYSQPKHFWTWFWRNSDLDNISYLPGKEKELLIELEDPPACLKHSGRATLEIDANGKMISRN